MMKKIIFLLPILLLTMWSCQEDSYFDENLVETNNDVIKVVTMNGNNHSKSSNGFDGKILSFPSWEEYQKTLDDLENQTRINDQWFVNLCSPNMTDDEIENLSTQVGYDELKPYKDFEKRFSFTSLRSKIYDAETEWLKNQPESGDWDLSTDPDNHFIFDDLDRTMFNVNNEIIVKDVIIRKYDWGYVEIYNFDTDLYNQQYSQNSTSSNPNLFISHYSDPWADGGGPGSGSGPGSGGGSDNYSCKSEVYYDSYFHIESKKKIRMKAKLERPVNFNFLGSNKYVSKTRYYRKKWGIWVRSKTNGLGVKIIGNTFFNGCGNDTYTVPSNIQSFGNKSGVESRYHLPFGYRFAGNAFSMKDNQIYARHYRHNSYLRKRDYFDGVVSQ